MKKILALALTLLMILTLGACGNTTPPSSPDSTPDAEPQGWQPVTPGKLTVGTSADYAPFEGHILIDGKDEIKGFDISLAQAIADELGLELVIVDMAFENVLNEVKLGNIDLAIAGIVPNEERAKEFDFSKTYYAGYKCLLIKAENADKYKTVEDFAGLSVGAQTNSIEEILVTTVVTDCLPVLLQAIPNLVMEVKAGQLEAACIESTVAASYVAKNPDLMIAMEVPSDGSKNSVAIAKGNTELLEAVNAVIDTVLANGQMDQFVADAIELFKDEE